VPQPQRNGLRDRETIPTTERKGDFKGVPDRKQGNRRYGHVVQNRQEERHEAAQPGILHNEERLLSVFAFKNVSYSTAETLGVF